MYNIDQVVERAASSPMDMCGEVGGSLSCASSIDRDELSRAMPRSSSCVQETKQLLELMSSSQDLHVSRLASEV